MKKSVVISSLGLVAATSFLVGSFAIADPSMDAPQMQLPPGWTMEDMQACMVAGMPGKMHAHMAQSVGEWEGKNTMVMAPGMPEMKSTTTMSAKMIMDGRYLEVSTSGDMPGMGPFKGMGVFGYDNVSQKFVAVWLDNMGTGIMNGTGEMSADGKTMTTTYEYNCPVNKKPAMMREVETDISPTMKKLEFFANDPKTGKEFQMMTIEYTKKS